MMATRSISHVSCKWNYTNVMQIGVGKTTDNVGENTGMYDSLAVSRLLLSDDWNANITQVFLCTCVIADEKAAMDRVKAVVTHWGVSDSDVRPFQGSCSNATMHRPFCCDVRLRVNIQGCSGYVHFRGRSCFDHINHVLCLFHLSSFPWIMIFRFHILLIHFSFAILLSIIIHFSQSLFLRAIFDTSVLIRFNYRSYLPSFPFNSPALK